MQLRFLIPVVVLGAFAAGCSATPPSARADRPSSPHTATGRASGRTVEQPAGERGALAPDFALPDLDGKTVRLSDQRGKVVLVGFWATWCGPCEKEIPHLKALHADYANKGLVIVGLSVDRDGTAPVRAFVRRHAMTWTNALADEAVIESFGPIPGIPATFIIDRKGRIAKRFIGLQSEARLRSAVEPLL